LSEQRYYYATGRRKTAVARVRLYPGDGAIVVNGRPIEDYFPVVFHRIHALEPLSHASNSYHASVKVVGGGVAGQAGAVRHGLARALCVHDPELRSDIKRAGLLTRDARAKERKKPGLKRARKAPQFTKR